MLNLRRRLRKLEKQLGTAVDVDKALQLKARLQAARLRCGSSPPSPERVIELRGMTVCQILYSGRQQAAVMRVRVSGLRVRELVNPRRVPLVARGAQKIFCGSRSGIGN